MLKSLGIASWIGCLLVLAYQAVHWILFASWPSVTILTALNAADVDILTLVDSLPLDVAIKAAYVSITTQLSLFMWWLGVFFFILTILKNIFLKK